MFVAMGSVADSLPWCLSWLSSLPVRGLYEVAVTQQ